MDGNMAHLLTPSPGYPHGFPNQAPFYHVRSPHLPTYQQQMFYGHPMQQRFNFGPEVLDYVLRGYLSGPEVRHSGLALSGIRPDVRPSGLAVSGLRSDQRHSGLAVSGLRITQDGQGESWRRSRTPETSPTERREIEEKPWNTSALGLPNHLEVRHIAVSQAVQCGVFTKILVKKGTRFGPYKGKVVTPSEIKFHGDNAYMWEIFKNGQLSHFLDGKNLTGNWMSYVNCARSKSEQNLKVVQSDDKIYYESIADIPRGTELLVWYGESYEQHMGIPTGLQQLEQNKETRSAEADVSEGFPCDRCGKMFAYRYYRDKHLKYTRCVDQGDRKFPCSLCKRSFEKKDRLRIHVLHVHEKHRPHSCQVCGKSFSQSSSLNKHIRVHSGERPYKCVYCNKAFTASSILRTHIRQHSGEKPFKCRHCGKAFASHAAHDSHVRRTHKTSKSDNSKITMFTNAPSIGGSLSPTSVLMNSSSVSRSDTSSSGFSEIDISSDSGGDEIIDVEA